MLLLYYLYFFFQAEDGIRDHCVTGVQTCALPILKALVQKLLMCRVKPYYIYQCDLISGSAHLRASVRKGLEIMEGLRGHTTGYAVPQYVIDAPGGGGKVPVNPNYVLSRNADRVVIRNFEGKVFEYVEAANTSPRYKASEDFVVPELV